jgi:putative methionine-R-sulfoxide reductase with GAF domain
LTAPLHRIRLLLVKLYRPARAVLADIEQVLSRPFAPNSSPLEEVAEILSEGRHYSWVGIYLTMDRKSSALLETGHHPAVMAVPGTRSKVLVAIKIAGRELGVLNVESAHESAFGSEDRVLLERVAGVLARFLTGPGKYLVRKAAQAQPAPSPRAAAA